MTRSTLEFSSEPSSEPSSIAGAVTAALASSSSVRRRLLPRVCTRESESESVSARASRSCSISTSDSFPTWPSAFTAFCFPLAGVFLGDRFGALICLLARSLTLCHVRLNPVSLTRSRQKGGPRPSSKCSSMYLRMAASSGAVYGTRPPAPSALTSYFPRSCSFPALTESRMKLVRMCVRCLRSAGGAACMSFGQSARMPGSSNLPEMLPPLSCTARTTSFFSLHGCIANLIGVPSSLTKSPFSTESSTSPSLTAASTSLMSKNSSFPSSNATRNFEP
mmetsp:Transcript_15487/g.36981  ORF Transcript_15487/g.36981 Transcript_15487/m.36981 type:complete len:278 (+) Transcript_15487:806-1639(+)